MRIRPITRGPLGGDAVYCAAYRGGRALWNERTGDLYKHDGRQDVRDTGIVLPAAVTKDPAYGWAKDPYKLWNTAEFSESQHNGRVARDYMMILPEEMTPEQRRDVVYRFAQTLADRYGNAIDVALHDKREGRARHYHAHLMGTTRKVGPHGLLEKTDAEVSGQGRAPRGLQYTYRQEYDQIRVLWENTLQEAVREAGLPREVYATLYREYGKGETTWDYHKRLMKEGYDLREQQREDRRKTMPTAEQRHESARKKWDIRKFKQLQREARKERKLEAGSELKKAIRNGGRTVQSADRHKRLWLPRWDVHKGLLKPWEVELQTRRMGETPAMVPWMAKANPGPEPEFEPEPEPKAPEPKKNRPDLEEEPHQPSRDIQPSSLDPVREWLAQKLPNKSDDQPEAQAVRDWIAHKSTLRRDAGHELQAARSVRDWIADNATQKRDNASAAQHVRDWVDVSIGRQQNHAPLAASESAREWLTSRQPQAQSRKEDEKRVAGGPSYDLDR
jgi:MobA/MobL family